MEYQQQTGRSKTLETYEKWKKKFSRTLRLTPLRSMSLFGENSHRNDMVSLLLLQSLLLIIR